MKIFIFTAFLVLAGMAHADEPQLDYRPLGVGVGMLIAPTGMTDSGLPWGHAIELEGFSYAATDIMDRLVPEKPFLGLVIIGAADILYRSGEDLGQDLTRRKLACDLLGVLGRVSVDFKF